MFLALAPAQVVSQTPWKGSNKWRWKQFMRWLLRVRDGTCWEKWHPQKVCCILDAEPILAFWMCFTSGSFCGYVRLFCWWYVELFRKCTELFCRYTAKETCISSKNVLRVKSIVTGCRTCSHILGIESSLVDTLQKRPVYNQKGCCVRKAPVLDAEHVRIFWMVFTSCSVCRYVRLFCWCVGLFCGCTGLYCKYTAKETCI